MIGFNAKQREHLHGNILLFNLKRQLRFFVGIDLYFGCTETYSCCPEQENEIFAI